MKIYVYGEQKFGKVKFLVVHLDMPIYATESTYEDLNKTLTRLKKDFSENGENVEVFFSDLLEEGF